MLAVRPESANPPPAGSGRRRVQLELLHYRSQMAENAYNKSAEDARRSAIDT